jgi:hypothetical protein
MFIVVYSISAGETLLCERFSKTELIEHLGATREERDSAAILVLGGLCVLLDDFDAVC